MNQQHLQEYLNKEQDIIKMTLSLSKNEVYSKDKFDELYNKMDEKNKYKQDNLSDIIFITDLHKQVNFYQDLLDIKNNEEQNGFTCKFIEYDEFAELIIDKGVTMYEFEGKINNVYVTNLYLPVNEYYAFIKDKEKCKFIEIYKNSNCSFKDFQLGIHKLNQLESRENDFI